MEEKMSIPVFDAHCDTILEITESGESLRLNSKHIDLTRAMCFAPYAQVFAVFCRPWPEDIDFLKIDYSKDWPEDALKAMGGKLLDALLREFEACGDILSHCRSAKDARQAAIQGKTAAFVAIEGAELIGCSLDSLDSAYKKGVRLINLCWNFDNALCGAANAGQGGLTEKGRAYVRRMQELGIAVDLSHASEKTFWDAVEIASRPIIAGHSNSKTICENPRNLTDAQFKALVELKGVAGINLYPEFLTARHTATIDDVVTHIDHFMELGGEKAVCLGGDLDGISETPAGIAGIQDYDKIFDALLKRGYSENTVRDIFYNNLLEAMERVL